MIGKSPQVLIQIVVWNSKRFLKDTLDSVFGQTYNNFSVLVIDNASRDDSVQLVKENYPKAYVLRNAKNLGFSRAHNQGIAMTRADFILVMNPDVMLAPDFLEKLIGGALQDETIGSLAGKMLKFKSGDAEIEEKIKTKIIDSAGLKIFKNRRIIDRGEGEKDAGQYDKAGEIFGPSGACALYRKKMLEDVKMPLGEARDEYFDEDFFAYKEDVDLAWRARLRGWKAFYLPGAQAYHFRFGAPSAKRFSQSSWVNFLSFRNHLWMLVKNSFWQNFLAHFWFLFFYQLSKEVYLLFREPKVLFRGSWSFWQGFGKMWEKRRYILKNAKINRREMGKWFQSK